jgi:cobalt-zinc-cadmium efflux system outer membrane protein
MGRCQIPANDPRAFIPAFRHRTWCLAWRIPPILSHRKIMLFFRVPALIALLLLAPTLHAEQALIITLSGVSARVHAQNPDLAAARLRIEEAVGRMNQSGRLANPEIESAFEHNPRFREGRIEAGFSQRFPVTDKLLLEKAISLTQLKAAEAEVLEVERQLVSRAKTSVVRIIATRQHRDLLKNQMELASELANNLTEASRKGEGSALDAAAARLETAGISVELRQLDAAEAAEIGLLKPLLGMLPGSPVSVGGSLPPPMVPMNRANPAGRPDFQAAMLEVDAARQGIDLQHARRYDDVEAGLFAAAERAEDVPRGYDNEAILGLRFRIPLPLWNQNEGAIQEARATHERRKLEATALSRNIRLEAESDHSQMIEWAKLVRELDETLLPLAEAQANAAGDAFTQGQTDIQTIFRSREKRLRFAAARLDALREFHLARVRYEAAIGTP